MKNKPTVDTLIGHDDETDGIQEFDNAIPAWFHALFFISILAGVALIIDWHVIKPKSLEGIYEQERADAIARYGVLEPLFVAFDVERAQRGAPLYDTYCVACHGAHGEGLSGPSFLDNVWTHGGEIDDINRIIFFGVPGQPMPPWGPALGADAVADLASFIYQLSLSDEDEL